MASLRDYVVRYFDSKPEPMMMSSPKMQAVSAVGCTMINHEQGVAFFRDTPDSFDYVFPWVASVEFRP